MSTRKELIAEGKDITSLTREEYFLAGKTLEPLNVKEKVLKGVVGGGGGGDSDFTTAKVKLISSTDKIGTLTCVPVVDKEFDCTHVILNAPFDNEGSEFEVVLYKGKYLFAPDSLLADVDFDVAPVLTGDVELDPENFEFIVTGDCTITMAGTATRD